MNDRNLPNFSFKADGYPVSLDIISVDDSGDKSLPNINGLLVSRLFVHKRIRGKGYARQAMDKLCLYADENQLDLILQPNAYGEMKQRQLIYWYKRLGFKRSTYSAWVYDNDQDKRRQMLYIRKPKGESK